jgi:choline-sulfatase
LQNKLYKYNREGEIMRVLFIDIDTLRPDHLGCYGYHRNTSPNIDKIAEQGVKFENYYCSDAPCLPSRSALMSGQFGIHTGVVGHGGTCSDMRLQGESRGFQSQYYSHNCLPTIFRKQGMHTVSISPFAERHSSWEFNSGFNETHNTGLSGGEKGEVITEAALKWIEQYGDEDNWFLHVNWWDPHTPYRTPLDYTPFKDDPIPDWITEDILDEHRTMAGPHGAKEINMYDSKTFSAFPKQLGEIKTTNDLKQYFDGYDSGIRYADDQIAVLLKALEKKGVNFDNLAIIITSDHGENLGELGLYSEHATADNITCRIPMIIKWPNCKKGHSDKNLHYNLDLAPTLAELFEMNAEESKATWDGKSFAETVTRGKELGHNELILSQCAHVCQRSVRWDDYIYIRTYHDGYHLFPKEMLFNLKEDPYEQNNLAKERLDLCKEGAYRLMDWHDHMMETQPDGYTEDPMRKVIAEGGPHHAKGFLSDYCERLKNTDRSWAIPELKKRHPQEF